MSNEAERAVVSLWCARAHVGAAPGLGRHRARRRARRMVDGARRASPRCCCGPRGRSGLVALLAPRPWGLTALRVVAPAAVVVAVARDRGTERRRRPRSAVVVERGRRRVRAVGAGRAGRRQRARVRRRGSLPAAHPARRCSSARFRSRSLLDRRRRRASARCCSPTAATSPASSLTVVGLRARGRARRGRCTRSSCRWLVLVPAGRRRRRSAHARRSGADATRADRSASSARPTRRTDGRRARPPARHAGRHDRDHAARAAVVRPPARPPRRRRCTTPTSCSCRPCGPTRSCATAGDRRIAIG